MGVKCGVIVNKGVGLMVRYWSMESVIGMWWSEDWDEEWLYFKGVMSGVWWVGISEFWKIWLGLDVPHLGKQPPNIRSVVVKWGYALLILY